jgi:hypothetical protein
MQCTLKLLSDIVERFQLSLMLIVVAFRIIIELSGTEFDGSLLPKSFGWVRGGSMLWTIMMVNLIPCEVQDSLMFDYSRS